MGALKDIETFLIPREKLNDDGVPSMSMAILEDPAAGIQNHIITSGDNDTDTVYQACSISKAITALAVAKLIDQGELSYETKVTDYVPWDVLNAIVDTKTEHLLEYVTVGRLVSHTSGLSQHGFPGYVGEPPGYQEIFSGKPPSNTPRIRFSSFPGSQVSYSGGGFTLLQILLEKLLAKPFPQIMQETVLQPLNMTRSRYGDLEPGENNYARAYSTAYTLGTSANLRGYHRFPELAAAGLWTTPSDLLKAVSAIQRSLYSQDGFLTPQTAREMLTPVSPNDSKLSMAMGWGSDDTFFAHAGDNDPGYQCYVVGAHSLPQTPQGGNEKSLASVAIMCNSSIAFPTIKRTVAAIFTLKGWPLYSSLPCNFGSLGEIVPFTGPDGILLGNEWKAFIGHWRADTSTDPSTSTDEYEIYDDEGTPRLAFDGVEEPMRLMPGALYWKPNGRDPRFTFVVHGLEMALGLVCDEEVGVGRRIDLVQESVTTLWRVR